MNTFSSLKCAAILLPVLVLGMPMANAGDKDCDCPCDPERSTAMIGSDRDQQREDRRLTSTQPAQPAAAAARSGSRQTVHNQYLAAIPARGYHSDSLVGHDVMNRRNNETLGTVSNLVLDEDGQVVAAIISVGGVLGIGARDVAIAWDQIERKVAGDELTLSVDLTEKSLKDAPDYSSDWKDSTKTTRTNR